MRSVALALLICLALPACAAVPGDSLPIYPKGKIEFEMTLTEKDFLPAIKEFIPTIPEIAKKAMEAGGGPGDAAGQALAGAINDEFIKELTESIAGLRKISVMGYAVPKGVTSASIAEFYMQKLGLTKGWQRTLRAEQGDSFVRFYTKPDLEAMLGIAMENHKVFVGCTEGKIDFARLTKLAGKFIPMALSVHQSRPAPEQPQPEPPPAVEVTPEPAPPAETPAPSTETPQNPAN